MEITLVDTKAAPMNWIGNDNQKKGWDYRRKKLKIDQMKGATLR